MCKLKLKLAIAFLCLLNIQTAFGEAKSAERPSQFVISATPADHSVTVKITLPADVNRSTLSAKLNGKEISSKFTAAACGQGQCEQAVLNETDGVHDSKNLLSVMARREDRSLVSTHARFPGTAAVPKARAAIKSAGGNQANAIGLLPTLSDFLPPAIAFNTLQFGGYDSSSGKPWIQIGSQYTYPSDPSSFACTREYTVIVLDRQTLQEKTAAPESSPQCISDGGRLSAYLATLNATDLVIVGTNLGVNSDASVAPGFLNLSSIGGSAYNCVDPTSCTSLPSTTVTSADVPLGYMAIGVGGAASGSAYENYYLPDDSWVVVNPHATGTLIEDPSGNYNFQTSTSAEYTIIPSDPSANGFPTITITTVRGDPYYAQGVTSKQFVAPFNGPVEGMWVLKIQRSTLYSVPFDQPPPHAVPSVTNADACPETAARANGVAFFGNCGRFYYTGNPDPVGAAGAYSALADDLADEDSRQLVFLVSVGNQPGFPGLNATMVSSELASAFSSLGGAPETLTTLGIVNSAYSFVGCVTCGNSLGGHAVVSATIQSQQGQNGYIRGLLQPNLNGLYWPTQASLDQPGTDGKPTADFTMQEVTSTQPEEWPELSNTQKLTSGSNTADSTGGQNAAYYYISYQLINFHYIVGAQGSFIDDIHYYFTSGNNTFLDYHNYDPNDLAFPGGTCFNWTDPVPGRGPLACFTQNDFNAVRNQMHNEILYLTNVIQFMVNGSTNMKDIVASGNGSAALALINAAAAVQGSTLQPPPATPIKSNVANILDLVGNAVGVGATLGGLYIGVPPEGANSLKTLVEFLGPPASVTSGSLQMASAVAAGLHTAGGPAPIPSRDYTYLTTIGSLSSNQLQQSFTAGFDSGLDMILADWYKLSVLGPKITDSNSPGFQAPTQASQLLAITQIGQAAQRNFYMALLPLDYSVQHYTYWFGDPSVVNEPDMGARTDDIPGHCNTWYYKAPAPTTINLVSKSYFSYADEGPTQFAFWYNDNTSVPIPMPIDWYVLASSAPASNPGTDKQQIQLLDSQVAGTLFSYSQLNIPMDPFLDIAGPMASVWADAGGKSHFTNFPANQTCSLYVAGKYGNQNSPKGGVGAPNAAVKVTLHIPATGVLGDSISLQATAAVAGAALTAGTIAFSDGNTEIGRAPLDETGTATLSIATLALGDHTIDASFVASEQYTATTAVSASITIFTNDPDIAITASATSVSITSGSTSSPVSLQVTSKRGLAGSISFTCLGLPAGSTCNFSPNQVNLTDGSSATTSLTITSTKQAAAMRALVTVFATMMLPLPMFGFRRNRFALRFVCALVFIAGTSAMLNGCGSGSPSTPTNSQPSNTTVLVTATSGNISRSVPIDLIVQ